MTLGHRPDGVRVLHSWRLDRRTGNGTGSGTLWTCRRLADGRAPGHATGPVDHLARARRRPDADRYRFARHPGCHHPRDGTRSHPARTFGNIGITCFQISPAASPHFARRRAKALRSTRCGCPMMARRASFISCNDRARRGTCGAICGPDFSTSIGRCAALTAAPQQRWLGSRVAKVKSVHPATASKRSSKNWARCRWAKMYIGRRGVSPRSLTVTPCWIVAWGWTVLNWMQAGQTSLGFMSAMRSALNQAMRRHAPRTGARGLVLCHIGHARPDGASMTFTWLFARILENEIAQTDAIRQAA